MKERASIKKRLLFSALVLAILFTGAEIVLRVHDFNFYFNFGADILGMPLLDLHSIRRTMNNTVEFDPYLFWKFKPNQKLTAHGIYRKPVTINSRGFRGPEFDTQKPPHTYRIVCLGDSTTFGWSVGDDETYPYQLQRLLSGGTGKGRVEVINLGVTGYTSLQGRELMIRQAEALDPDLVIFAFGPNDRLPALKSDQEHLDDRTWDIGPITVFLNHFQVYKLLKSGVVYLGNRMRGMSLDPATYIPRLKRKVSPQEFVGNALAVKKLCDKIGADMILIDVDYPSLPPDHVTGEIEKEAKESGASMPRDWAEWDTQQVFAKASAETGAPWIDMRKLFAHNLELIQKGELDAARTQAKRTQLGDEAGREPWRYLMVDNGHPNEWGHDILAHVLADKIAQLPRFKKFKAEGKVQ